MKKVVLSPIWHVLKNYWYSSFSLTDDIVYLLSFLQIYHAELTNRESGKLKRFTGYPNPVAGPRCRWAHVSFLCQSFPTCLTKGNQDR
jgi:hypothetical protein